MSPLLALLTVAVLDTTAAEVRPGRPASHTPAPVAEAPDPAPRLPSPLELGRMRQEDPSDGYYLRLKIHRWSSYAMLPLFAFQYAAGAELYKGSGGADWAEDWHGVGATAIASVFAVNVVTGVPNLIETWNEPRDRKRRLFHASAMLIAAAGFTATGILAEEAEDASGRSLHRSVALGSMGVATIGYLSMLDLFRKD